MITADDKPEFERKRQQIIDGALTVFAAKGFAKATNQDIAEAAGIGSPGLIYHYFENKKDLLHQAVRSRAHDLRSLVNDETLMAMSPREALRTIAATFLQTLTEPTNLNVFRVMVGETARDAAVAANWHATGFMPVLGGLAHYFGAQMQAGNLRRMDPLAAAVAFVGPLFLYVMSREVLRLPHLAGMAHDDVVDATVDVFLQGMEVA